MPIRIITRLLLTFLATHAIVATPSPCDESATLVTQALSLGDNRAILPQQQTLLTQAITLCPA